MCPLCFCLSVSLSLSRNKAFQNYKKIELHAIVFRALSTLEYLDLCFSLWQRINPLPPLGRFSCRQNLL